MKETDPKEIPVIIPSYEPDEKLPGLLESLRAEGFLKLILVDDGSGEEYQHFFRTAEEKFHCHILHHEENRGKGRALKTAFAYVLREFPDAVGCITADSDGQHTPACILDCARALLKQPDALIMGCRSFDREDVPARSEFGNKCTRLVMKYLTGISLSDTQTGLRGIPASFMEELLTVKGERFEFETNMLMETRKNKIPIVEVPIQTIYIEENKTSHFNPVRDSIRIYMLFGKFLFSSLSSSVADLVLFAVFCHLLKGQGFGGIGYIAVSTALARVLSAIYNYTMNYKVVFESKSSVGASLARYILLAAVQMCCSALLVSFLFTLTGGPEILVKIPVDTLLFLLSYVIQREFVY